MNGLNPRERRLLALGLLVLVLAATWLGVVSPLLDGYSARRAERATLLGAYQRNQRLLDAIPVLRAVAEEQKRSAGTWALIAPSQVQAQELLKQRLSAAMVAAGAAPPGVQELQGDLPPGWIGARADAQLTLSQLNASLRRLESEEPYAVVDQIAVIAGQAAHTGRPGLLQVRIQISTAFRQANGQPL